MWANQESLTGNEADFDIPGPGILQLGFFILQVLVELIPCTVKAQANLR